MEDRLGEIRNNNFGTPMKIIAYRRHNDIDVEFLDDNHYIKEHSTYGNFKDGKIKNPYDPILSGKGYIGDGEYKCKPGDKTASNYYAWTDMIHRCYSTTEKWKYDAYYGLTSVCKDWLNFQNFAKWFDEHYYETEERLHVDKDIKYPGNKIYSPYHCVLVPQRINMLFTNKANKRGLPNGIHNAKNGYSAKYGGKELGTYNSLEEAYGVYSKAKKRAIVEVANEYKNKIPDELYKALLNYEVRIENDKNWA